MGIAQLLLGGQVIGMDLSEIIIEIAASNTMENGVSRRDDFQEGSASVMPVEGKSFDFVVSGGSLPN